MFLKGINESTLFPIDTIKVVEVAGKVGFNGIEFRIPKIAELIKENKIKLLIETLNSYKMEVISLNSIVDFNLIPSEKFGKILRKTIFLSKVCSELNCSMLIVCPSFISDIKSYEKNYIFKKTANRLELLAKLAREWNINIGFEFLGHSACSVNKLSDAYLILEKISDIENVKLVVDTYNFYLSNESLEVFEKIPIKMISLIHINDAPEIPREKLTDDDRIFPGEGVIQLKKILNILKEKGYKGYVSIEVFNENYWKEPPQFVAEKAIRSLEALL